MMSQGRVREWHDDDGWGVIESPSTPGGCWTHYSAVLVAGARRLRAGEDVLFTSEVAAQDGYAFRAVEAWPSGEVPLREGRHPEGRHPAGPSAAMASELRITFDSDRPEGPARPARPDSS